MNGKTAIQSSNVYGATEKPLSRGETPTLRTLQLLVAAGADLNVAVDFGTPLGMAVRFRVGKNGKLTPVEDAEKGGSSTAAVSPSDLGAPDDVSA